MAICKQMNPMMRPQLRCRHTRKKAYWMPLRNQEEKEVGVEKGVGVEVNLEVMLYFILECHSCAY